MCALKTKSFSVFKLSELKNTIPIKFISNPVNAGFPSPAQDFIEDVIDLNSLLIKHPSSTFLLKVKGISMEGASIFDGSHILVDTSLRPSNNDIGVCIIDGEFTLKRLSVDKDKLYLMPENKLYKPIEIKEGNDFSIWGIVTYIFNKPNSRRI